MVWLRLRPALLARLARSAVAHRLDRAGVLLLGRVEPIALRRSRERRCGQQSGGIPRRRFGLGLSGGKQQRLCVARGVAVRPEVLLLDEPTSALDPISSAKLEETVTQLKADYTIVIVTHNLGQAARLSDYTGFMYLGELVEFGETGDMFTKPVTNRASDYITGRFG